MYAQPSQNGLGEATARQPLATLRPTQRQSIMRLHAICDRVVFLGLEDDICLHEAINDRARIVILCLFVY
jgi:hypothetical protein